MQSAERRHLQFYTKLWSYNKYAIVNQMFVVKMSIFSSECSTKSSQNKGLREADYVVLKILSTFAPISEQHDG